MVFRIPQSAKEFTRKLSWANVVSSMCARHYGKNEHQNCPCINISNCRVNAVYLVYVSDKKYSNHLNLLHLNDERKEQYIYRKN